MLNSAVSVFLVVFTFFSRVALVNQPASNTTDNPHETSILTTTSDPKIDLPIELENKNSSSEFLEVIPDEETEKDQAVRFKKLIAEFAGASSLVIIALQPSIRKIIVDCLKSMFKSKEGADKNGNSIGSQNSYSIWNISNELKTRISGSIQVIGQNIRLASNSTFALCNIGNKTESIIDGNIKIATPEAVIF